MKESLKKIISFRYLQILAVVLIFWVIILKVREFGENDQFSLLFRRPTLSIAALPIIFIGLGLHAIGWRKILQSLGEKLSLSQTFHIYFFSALSRYLPGSLWYIPYRSSLGAQTGVSSTSSLLSTGAELILKTMVGLLLCLMGLIIGIKLELSQLFLIGMWIGIGLLAILIIWLLGKRSKNKYLPKFETISRFLLHTKISSLLGWSFIYLIAWFVQGISLYIVLNIWQDLSPNNYLAVTIAYIFSWIAGFVNPFTPNGLGSREAVLILTLSNIAPAPVVLAASIVMRILGLIGECFWAGVGWSYNAYVQRKSKLIL